MKRGLKSAITPKLTRMSRRSSRQRLLAEIEGIERHAKEYGIPAPVTFAYPGRANVSSAQVYSKKATCLPAEE